ncbi:MAG: phytanoyl-CoA dioxygenase family protein [Niastella sp.]|nr:phytanoyl-CoA dioxygenase family protein [Niastella sp.]
MIDCSFLPVFYEHHQCIKAGAAPPAFKGFGYVEEIWMGFYGLGKFETFQFLYGQCSSLAHLQDWMIALKGEAYLQAAALAFDQWMKRRTGAAATAGATDSILSEDQWLFWQQEGYIRVSGIVDEGLCDAVCQLICAQLGVDLQVPATWYNDHPGWHGLMLQLYQHESIHAIKTLPAIEQLFAALYGTSHLIANTEKVSFNPPETGSWKFRHHTLHWDIDFTKADRYYIQGLVYLNDVPESRGPLTVVPKFHHQFEDWLQTYPDPNDALQMVQHTYTGTPVPRKKGDVVCWLQTLPHAASANHSDVPRFVQYVSFSKL